MTPYQYAHTAPMHTRKGNDKDTVHTVTENGTPREIASLHQISHYGSQPPVGNTCGKRDRRR